MKYLICRVLAFPRTWGKTIFSILVVAFTIGWGLFTGADFFELIRMSIWLAVLCTLGVGTTVMAFVPFAWATQRAYDYCRKESSRREHEDLRQWHDEQYERCLGECIVESGGGTPVWKSDAVETGEKS